MKELPVRMWVHPKFKEQIKIRSTKLGIPTIKLTKELCEFDDLEEYFKNGKKNFRI